METLMRCVPVQFVSVKVWKPPSLHLESSDLETPVWRRDAFYGTWKAYTKLCSLLAAIHFLRKAYNALCEVLAECEDEKRVEFGVLREGTEKQRLKNGNRSHTNALRYFGGRHYYISIRSVVFKNIICSWIGITDCSILHFTGLEKNFALSIAHRCCMSWTTAKER